MPFHARCLSDLQRWCARTWERIRKQRDENKGNKGVLFSCDEEVFNAQPESEHHFNYSPDGVEEKPLQKTTRVQDALDTMSEPPIHPCIHEGQDELIRSIEHEINELEAMWELPFDPSTYEHDYEHEYEHDYDDNNEDDYEGSDLQDGLENFAAVLAELNRDHLPEYALSVLRRIDPDYSGKAPTIFKPVCGSYNVCFPIEFDNNVRWMARFPVSGTKERWDDLCSRALASEAETMKMLKKETTIPLPDVIDYCSTVHNELKCPYMLITYISGYSLYDVWWGEQFGIHDHKTNSRCRRQALEDIASAMSQLRKFTFEKGGFLEFDPDGKPSVGPMRVIDHQAGLDYNGEGKVLFYAEAGPFLNPEDQYTFGLHQQRPPFQGGVADLLKMFISYIPEVADGDQFDLAHPDFALQNFIVSEERHLLGIIDWDGAAAVPLSMGSRKYPSWLTADWDFPNYELTPTMDDEAGHPLLENEGANLEICQDSPRMLKYYRRVYRDFMAAVEEESPGPLSSTDSLKLTRNSLLTTNLFIGATWPQDTYLIAHGFMRKIEAIAAEAGMHVDFIQVVDDIVAGNLDTAISEDLEGIFNWILDHEH
ncbi:uncharacterized protein DNG_04264 [Cephalotrichum gorgonifer]|uniref:Aminoglycoside phosphotransferase domain-containing protein n=1 Tax=Cephalotrichum gorgonifer TaxID=2041049 RepID=A0AAE8SV00_9PEZI|nr:uncharacterized protein DNG_04264 [Cephalotrichum gorgonifer]